MGLQEYEQWRKWASQRRGWWAKTYSQTAVDSFANEKGNDAHLHWGEISDETMPGGQNEDQD